MSPVEGTHFLVGIYLLKASKETLEHSTKHAQSQQQKHLNKSFCSKNHKPRVHHTSTASQH